VKCKLRHRRGGRVVHRLHGRGALSREAAEGRRNSERASSRLRPAGHRRAKWC